MLKNWITLVIVLNCSLSFGQSGFENGYFISDNGEKVNCLIRNKDWGYNPKQFKYKNNADETSLTGTIANIKEFGIGNTHKYQRFIVAFDRTTEEIDKLGLEKEPINILDTIFLRVLVEGPASLYYFESGELRRFFIQKENQPIEQLVYKTYITENRLVARNEYYKQQLLTALDCSNRLPVADLKYEKRELVRAFTIYNQCTGKGSSDLSSLQGKASFNLSIRPGMKFSNFKVSRPASPPVDPNPTNITFKDQTGFRFGIEAEFVLPVNKNKMSIIFEPTFQYYKSTSITAAHPASINYSSLELPIGVRFTFAPEAKTSFFMNFLYSSDLSFNSKIKFQNAGAKDIELKPGGAFCLGAGARIKKRYSAELRIISGRDLTKTNFVWSSNYSYAGLVLGYKINK